MDFPEAAKSVFNRIQIFDPENVSKIVGYLLLQDKGDREMIRLALGPDALIRSLIDQARADLGLAGGPLVSQPIRGPFHVDSMSPVSAGPRLFQQALATEDFRLQTRIQYLGLEDQIEPGGYYCPEPVLGPRTAQGSPGPPEFPAKICHYFNKGFCRHGSNCKYFHANNPETFPQNYIVAPPNEHVNESEHLVSPRSLERLEAEITELLRSRRGFPVSIASLPLMYYEIYGRSLQAEGYLTESQRHGKTGYSLTRLLARLKNSIRLIDRPHGQHSVILVEDLPRYLEYYASERNGGIVSGSRQIYLTFPAESTFTEHDVSNYFNKFGPVQDVRIPCQQERMFGFVTFVYPETVRHILSKGNPHFVCEARVLVKPYREKSRLVNRKFSERMLHPMCRHFIGGDLEFSPLPPRAYDMSRFRKQIIMENEQAFELDRKRFSEMNLTSRMLPHRPNFNYSMEELKFHEDDAEQEEFQSPERFDYLLDVMNNASTSEKNNLRIGSTDHVHVDQDSQGLNLPESPFASAIGNEIATFT